MKTRSCKFYDCGWCYHSNAPEDGRCGDNCPICDIESVEPKELTPLDNAWYRSLVIEMAVHGMNMQEGLMSLRRNLSSFLPYEKIKLAESELRKLELEIISFENGCDVEDVTEDMIHQWYNIVYDGRYANGDLKINVDNKPNLTDSGN